MAQAPLSAVLAFSMALPAGIPPNFAPTKHGDTSIDTALIRQTVEALGTVLDREYFDPVVAAQASAALKNRMAQGRYQNASTIESLAKKLSEDLYELTKDKHLVAMPVEEVASRSAAPPVSDETPRELAARRANFGIQRIEILPGNVGYLNFTAFYRPGEARSAIASAMASLRHADALILDLRENGGGSSGTMALLASYFFESQGLPLFEVVPRPPTKSVGYSTEATVLPDRNEQRPTYILVSGNTWSAGEGIAFILQERQRAVVVGQTTPGAGNQARTHLLSPQFEVTIPNGATRTAIRKSSWEGTGVVPDIFSAPSDALRIAHTNALKNLLKIAPNRTWHAVLEKQLGLLLEGGNSAK